VTLCERGLEVDPLAEDLWRELMRSHIALQRPTAALLAYRRCSEILARELGVPPSAETEALHRTLPQPAPVAARTAAPKVARGGTHARRRTRGLPARPGRPIR
jgi:DNA-binding SARP family transcriptional activator